MRAVTRWCSRLLAHWFIGYLGFVVDISFFMVGVRKPGKNNLLSLVGIQRASPSSQCWCTQSQMAEMLSRTTLCQCRSPKYPGFQAACQGWRIPPYPTHLIYYCTILVGWYMLIFIPGLGGRGSPDGAKKISGRLPPTRSHPRQLEALDTHGFSQPLPISSYQWFFPLRMLSIRAFSGLLGNWNRIFSGFGQPLSATTAVCPTELLAGHLSHAATPAGLWRVEPWTNPWLRNGLLDGCPWGGFLASHEPKSVFRNPPNMRFGISFTHFQIVLGVRSRCSANQWRTIPRGWNPTAIAVLFSVMQAK